MKENKSPFLHKMFMFSGAYNKSLQTWVFKYIVSENLYFFLKNYVISDGTVSQNVLYHQQLPSWNQNENRKTFDHFDK